MLTGVALWSCRADYEPSAPDAGEGKYVDRIAVSMATRAEGDEGPSTGGSGVEAFDLDTLIPYRLTFNDSTILQVSQKTRNINPFQTADITYNFSHIPYSDDDAWNDDNSYNFAPEDQTEALEWNKIGAGGSWNGGFALYSMYFPVDNAIRQKEGEAGTVLYSVMQDQSTLENLKRSDILGAYHSTPTLFSRIRFRLFHLMTYVRIRLYVPVFDEVKNTGYREGALQYATLDNVTPDFAIDWGAVRSPDTQGPAVSPLAGEDRIIMYQHPLPKGATQHPITEIKYKDYLRDGYFDQGIDGDYDRVRIYDFSVIIPNQKGIIGEDGKETNFTSTDFLNFYFRTNSGATTRYFFNQSLGANSNESSLEMNQGVFQYLQLYVPRVGNKVIFVGAKVNNWQHNSTEMLLLPDDVD